MHAFASSIRALGRAAACGLVASAVPGDARAAPALVVEPTTHLRVEVVLSGPGLPGTLGFLEMEARPRAPGEASIALPWPEGARLEVRATASPDPAAEWIEAEARVRRNDEVVSRAARRLALDGSGTTVWEVHRSQGRRIVLGIRLERRDRPTVQAPPRVGRPVAFRLYVERLQGDAAVLLETNDLNTFLEEGVEYSFRRGSGVDEERLRVRLLPLRILDDVLHVSVELEAALPGEHAPPPFRRSHTLFATRGVESVVTAAAGAPLSGYRFRVVAEF